MEYTDIFYYKSYLQILDRFDGFFVDLQPPYTQ